MRRLMVWTGTAVLLLGFSGAAEAQNDAARAGSASDGQEQARALIARAVQAHGGAEALGRIRAEKLKFKGTLVTQGHIMPFLTEITVQLPSKYRYVIETDNGGNKHTIVYLLNGNKSFITVDGRPHKAEAAELAEIRSGLELERAKRLLPLLEDKSYQLVLAEEIQVNDRPAVGVRITGRGRKEMRLFFDKEHGLLVRAENRIAAGKDKEVRQHFFFGDYKEIGGCKRPTKMRVYRDGRQIMEEELLDAKLLDKVDETEFGKP